MITQLLTDAINITYFQLDKYAVQFKQMGKNEYFINYTNRRELKNYGTRHAHASVDVFIGDSTIPVMNAVIKVENSMAKGKTDKNGHCTA